jgi:hypothetical protein
MKFALQKREANKMDSLKDQINEMEKKAIVKASKRVWLDYGKGSQKTWHYGKNDRVQDQKI